MAVQPWSTGPNFILIETSSFENVVSAGGQSLTESQARAQGFNAASALPIIGRTKTATEFNYLGTAAHCPKPSITRSWRPVPSSFRGLMQRPERGFMGQHADILMVLSRWDYGVYLQLCAASASSAGPGAFSGDDIGMLLNAQELGVKLHVLFPYFKFPKYGDGTGGRKGYRFLNCTLVRDQLLAEGGQEGQMLGLHWRAQSIYDEDKDEWLLYDGNVAPIPNPM